MLSNGKGEESSAALECLPVPEGGSGRGLKIRLVSSLRRLKSSSGSSSTTRRLDFFAVTEVEQFVAPGQIEKSLAELF